MEQLNGGDLFSYLEKRKFTVSESRAKKMSHQIATALYYLHSFGVAHRDLKPENILMVDDSDSSDLKIVDFGFCCPIEGKCGDGFSRSALGTPHYMAPEIWEQKGY